MSDTFGDAIKQVIQCCAESGGQAAMAACVVCEEIERLQQRLAAAEALLRTASVSELVKRAVKEAENERQ